MQTYKLFKERSASKKQQAVDAASTLPITPDDFGRFPTSFAVFSSGKSEGGGSVVLALCHAQQQQPIPFQSFTAYPGWGQRFLVMHSTIDVRSAPLAFVDNGKKFTGARNIILPPTMSQQGLVPGPHVLFKDKGGLTKSVYKFELPNAAGRAEIFEWRQCSKLTADPSVFELRAYDAGNDSEAFARWVQVGKPIDGRVGDFTLLGRGASGEFGPRWILTAVVTAMTVCHTNILTSQIVDDLIQGGAQALQSSLAFGIGFA